MCVCELVLFSYCVLESIDGKFSSYLSSGRRDPPLYFEYMVTIILIIIIMIIIT